MISLAKWTEDAQASLISLLETEQTRGIDLGELVAQVEIAIDFSGTDAVIGEFFTSWLPEARRLGITRR